MNLPSKASQKQIRMTDNAGTGRDYNGDASGYKLHASPFLSSIDVSVSTESIRSQPPSMRLSVELKAPRAERVVV
jgi:hypothetical protein